jgi:hypothetical protein
VAKAAKAWLMAWGVSSLLGGVRTSRTTKGVLGRVMLQYSKLFTALYHHFQNRHYVGFDTKKQYSQFDKPPDWPIYYTATSANSASVTRAATLASVET